MKHRLLKSTLIAHIIATQASKFIQGALCQLKLSQNQAVATLHWYPLL